MRTATVTPTLTPTLTLNRSGTFDLGVRGNVHCGLANNRGEVPCEYALTLCCDAKALDSDGFLVEQIGIDQFFKSVPPTRLSCELFCIECARLLYRKVMTENPNAKIHGIRLTISPRPKGAPGAAGMTFQWGRF